jgi:uncharacterized protein YpbB
MSMLDALDERLWVGDGTSGMISLKPKRQRERKPKAAKEIKPKTWEVSLALYLQHKSPEDIARERSLTLGTVHGHLVRYVDSGEVDFDDLVSREHQLIIAKVIRKIGTTEGTTPIKNLCPPDITYDEIRLMLSRM